MLSKSINPFHLNHELFGFLLNRFFREMFKRLNEIRSGKYKEKIAELKNMDKSEVEKIYKELQATKGASV